MSASSCTICQRRRRLRGEACDACRRRFGLPDDWHGLPRPPRPCASCGHAELIACIARERASDASLAPLAASYQRRLKTRILTGEEDVEYDDAPDLAAPIGVFVAYVCRACGFTEWYALRPDLIPIGPAYGTRLVIIERLPYR